jgi:hypothetical protein
MVSRPDSRRVGRPPTVLTTGPPSNVPRAVEGMVSAERAASTRLNACGGVLRWNRAVQMAVNGA